MRHHTAFISILFFLLSTPIFSQLQFIEHQIDADTHGMGSIFACDIDGDSDIDVLAASLEDNQILWFRNDGGNPITWSKIIIGAGVGSAHSVYAADIDGDQDLDIVGAAYTGTPGIAWWRNDGGDPVVWSKFTVANSFVNAHEIYCKDVDQDGRMDILGASSDLNTIAWWHNNGGDPITWTQQTLSSTVTLAKSVTAGDVDGDGDIDILGASIVDSDVIWWRNDGGDPIQWTQILIDNNFNGAHRLQIIDLDKDGDADVVGAGYVGHQIAWWRNDGGSPVVWTRQIIGSGFTNACVAYAIDLDNDSDLDVIGTGQGLNQIAWWRNDGGTTITWTKNIVQNNFTRPWPLYSCDVDGDGDNDIISGSSHNGSNIISWWETTITTDVDDSKENTPVGFELMQNYPNPFNPSTAIQYTIPAVDAHVTLKIYDILGRQITTLVNESQRAGTYNVTFDAGKLPSGIYYYCLQADSFTKTNKMLFLK